jgi:GNAT superfamily N-acetyltransferase
VSQTPLAIRPATAADLESVIALDRRMTGVSRRGFFEKRSASMTRDPDRFTWLVAESDGQLAGFVSTHVQEGEFGSTGRTSVIDAIATDPDRRGQGVGRALMKALEDELRACGVAAVRSEADWTDRKMVAFFAAAGFALAPQLILQRSVSA